MTEEQKTFTLTLSVEEVNLILAALYEQPAKVSMALIVEIKEQAQSQPKPTEG